jgi:hypothetical protein
VTSATANTASQTPSASGSSDLLSLIPTEAGPYTIEAQAVPSDLIPDYMRGIEQVLSAVGASPSDASLALANVTGEAIADGAGLYVLRVPGADGQALVQPEVERWLSQMTEGTEATQVTIGGKDVMQVGQQDPSFPKYAKYVYAAGDVLFVVDQAGNDAVIEAIFSALP